MSTDCNRYSLGDNSIAQNTRWLQDRHDKQLKKLNQIFDDVREMSFQAYSVCFISLE